MKTKVSEIKYDGASVSCNYTIIPERDELKLFAKAIQGACFKQTRCTSKCPFYRPQGCMLSWPGEWEIDE